MLVALFGELPFFINIKKITTMITKYHVRLSVENSRNNTLVKNINFTTQVELSYSNLNSILCHLIKDNYRYDIEKDWKLSKTAKILTFEEALIAIRDFRFVESNIVEEEVDAHEDTILCYLDTSFLGVQNWHSNSRSFCAIQGIEKKSDFSKLEEALFKVGFKKTKTKGIYYITGDYVLCIENCAIVLHRYYTVTNKVQKTIEI